MDSSTLTSVTDVLSALRDVAVIGGVLSLVWKARGMWEDGRQFIKSIKVFMETMSASTQTILNNHLFHIEQSGEQIKKDLKEQTQLLKDIKNDAKQTQGGHD